MEEKKMIMLTNKSERKFTTSQGDFHPGTSKEFDEAEAVNLLGYSKEILRVEDALGNPDIKDKIAKLEALVEAKDKEIKSLREEDGNDVGLQKKDARIKDLENEIKKLDQIIKVKDEAIADLEKKLKEATKKGSKK